MSSIAFRHGDTITDIGFDIVLHSLLSTVALHLEGGNWGGRFPLIMCKLYQGKLDAQDAVAALRELQDMQAGLASLNPDQVVWDINDLARQPPWGKAINPGTTSMANYHATVESTSLLDDMLGCVAALKEQGGVLEIIPFDGIEPFYYVS